jgi:tRNA threonylcarbamoyl adenosine modification protein YeaZ
MRKTILILDTSGETLRVGLFCSGSLKTLRLKGSDFSSDSLLFKAARRILDEAQLSISDVQALVVANGPGRFTGIRVGMTFTSILSSRLKIPALAISRLEAIAFGETEGQSCPVLIGYRGEKYYQAFNRKNLNHEPKPVSPPSWCSELEWAQKKREIEALGARIVEREAEVSDFFAAARFYLSQKKLPKFEPLYLKAASYERK